ncbi:hypothetical protein H261_17463 [Paramagnetospirillum caucaseum]|uniref:Lipoprotein n=1 Tax=Paramagnetospirillum caucaseum TaxID=1244869 RepID=M2Z2S7_9PROT|nr:hypothetical protein [Paramagnetospirillum caucaseum]EME68610.1 hypothetical protein H261_17463 [Paramagnetospirillum caucaseum]
MRRTIYVLASVLLLASCATKQETTGAKWGAIWASRQAVHQSDVIEGGRLYTAALQAISFKTADDFNRTIAEAVRMADSKAMSEGREAVLAAFLKFMETGPTPRMVDAWFGDRQRLIARSRKEEGDRLSAHIELGKKDTLPDGFLAERFRLISLSSTWAGAAEELIDTWRDFEGWKSDMAVAAQQDAEDAMRMSAAMMMFGNQMRQQSMAQQQMMQNYQPAYQKPIQCNSYKVGNTVQTSCY